MNREDWLKGEIAKIKAGADMRMVCVMSTPDRIYAGLCLDGIPADRLKRGSDTCSKECQADKKRLRRWQGAKGACRLCGHNLPKKKAVDVLRAAQEASEIG